MLGKKTSKQFKISITILVVLVLILTSFYAYFEFSKEEKINEKEEIERIEIDDRISPLTNQGLIFEVKRIRHRGLTDKIMKRGTPWRTKPKFYFITEMDGLEYSSKDVQSATGKSQFFFETWDTMFQENKIVRDVEEEQQTSEVTLIIMERVKTGFLGFKSKDLEKEKINLKYNYRTGRWTGDDNFNDLDGYGHYLGDSFEVWFNLYQTDYDGDGIPYWTEVNIINTDPTTDDSKLDPDEDGIPTLWEWRWNYEPHIWDDHANLDPDTDGIENIEEYQMAKWFANPYSQDIYLEVDSMEESGFFDYPHIFWEESQQILIERFASHGINVYIDDGWPGGPTNGGGDALPPYQTVSQDSGMVLQFYNNYFPDERKGIFRYVVVAHSAGFCHPSRFNRYDTITIANAPGIIIPRGGVTPRARRLLEAAMVMHELGHSLGVSLWNVPGCDNLSAFSRGSAKKQYLDEWGNYRSVMNYYYVYDKTLVDYSDGNHGPGDVNDWELFDLTYFQKDSTVIEDPGFEPPGEEEI